MPGKYLFECKNCNYYVLSPISATPNVVPAQAAAERRQLDYSWEDVVHNLAPVDMSKPGVVAGWRREKGETLRPKLYFRKELVKKKEELDIFFRADERKLLYVQGPPGSGKTSFFLLCCSQPVHNVRSPRVLVVQYRVLSRCEIMIVGNGAVKRLVTEGRYNDDLDAESLRDFVREVLVTEKRNQSFDYFVLDGVRQKEQNCRVLMQSLNTHFEGRKGIHITSLQFDVKDGDGTYRGDEYMMVQSWEMEDYREACTAHGFMDRSRLWKLFRDKNEPDEPEISDFMDDDKAAFEAFLFKLVERKFHYAGGSARFMFDFSMSDLIDTKLMTLLSRMNSQMWKAFATLKIGASAEDCVNSLMQQLRNKSANDRGIYEIQAFPVSKYVLEKAYLNAGKELLSALTAAAEKSDNPALQGWAFEIEQLDFVRSAIEEGKAFANFQHTLVLPTGPLLGVKFNGNTVSGCKEGVETFVIFCTKWNQGCFDAALFHDGQLLTLQFTVSLKHSLKMNFIRDLKESLKATGKDVKKLGHIAIVKGEDANQFTFDEPELAGYDDESKPADFEVGLFRSGKICARVESNSSVSLGDSLGITVKVFPERRSKRRRTSPSPLTY